MIDERIARAHRAGIPVEQHFRGNVTDDWHRVSKESNFPDDSPYEYRIAPGIEVREKWGGYSTASPWGSPDKFQFAGKNGYEWRPVETKPSKQVYEEAIRGWAALRTYVIEHAPARERDALMSYTNAISDALVASPAEPAPSAAPAETWLSERAEYWAGLLDQKRERDATRGAEQPFVYYARTAIRGALEATNKAREAMQAAPPAEPVGELPPLPVIDPKQSIPYEAIRYIAGYTEGFVQRYATDYARAAIAAMKPAELMLKEARDYVHMAASEGDKHALKVLRQLDAALAGAKHD